MKKTLSNVLSAVALIAIIPAAVFAQTPTSPTPCTSTSATICNPLQATSVTTILTDVVNIAIPIGAVIAVLMLVFVGFKFIFAQGKPEEINKTWKWFLWVVIGTAILLGAKVIISVITSTLTSAGAVQPGLLGQ